MSRARLAVAALAAVTAVLIAPALARADSLQMYTATVDQATFEEIADGGYDVASAEPAGLDVAVDLVLTEGERGKLARRGVGLSLLRDSSGTTVARRAALQARQGFTVFRDYDGPDGIAAELYEFARENRSIARLHVIGHTHQGREILAVELTQGWGHRKRGRRHGRDHDKPAVLYQGTTHAREWISTEVTRRLMHHFADSWPRDREIRDLLRSRSLWFLPVVNPDGYQYTFDHERLWRKNLRDVDGNGEITVGDGVDLNRNYPERWNYDDEGSSTQSSSDTFRGDAPGSEPETRADMELVDRIDPAFAVSYHSYGPLLLYPQGWQVQSPTPDDPIYIALSGTDEEPAVEGFDPDVAAELYTTNGEFTDWAHNSEDSLAWTPELEEGCQGCGFVFPDDEELVQAQFEKNLPFALDLARSADDPDDPESHLGNETQDFYLETVSADPTRANNPLSDFRFEYSYGDPQPVEVIAKRSLGRVSVRYRINGGRTRTAGTNEWGGGETHGGDYSTYYRHLRGEVTGTNPGDEVEVWFEARRARSEPFTYTAVTESDAETLIVAAEDYTGISNDPPYAGGPNYVDSFRAALDSKGIASEVYDVDANGRAAPDHLGVLGHFDSVVWYTANDVVTRDVGMVPGTASRLANDEMLEMRSYMNDGGKLLYNGQYAGFAYAGGYAFDPVANAPCGAGDPAVDARCQALSDDFLQYYLGAYIYNDGGGQDPETGEPFPITGTGEPFTGMDWTLNGPDSADNQHHTASFVNTSSLLPEEEYPQFASDVPAAWQTGISGAFEPYDGSQYMYSDRADVAYKRLTRTIDLTGVSAGDAPKLELRTSYDTEPAWDHLFVEARPADTDDWTTLPDANGHTTQETGDSCAEGWAELHPHLAHYQTENGDGTCTPTGTTGDWHAASGRSDGWEPWSIDLSDYAGQRVEVSIAYATDWGTQGLGVWLDAFQVSTGEGTTSFEDDDDPMDGWEVMGPPDGSGPNPNNWRRTGSVGFEEGAVVSTDDSLYMGFGVEGVSGAATRAEILGRGIGFLQGGG